MNKYETLFLIKPDLPEDQILPILERLQQRIEGANGKLAVIDHWGNRPLAYPVQYRGEKFYRGYYVLINYAGDGSTVDEVERNIKILDQTFRYISVKLENDIDPAGIGEVQVTRRPERTHRGRRMFREEEDMDRGAEREGHSRESAEKEGEADRSGSEREKWARPETRAADKVETDDHHETGDVLGEAEPKDEEKE